MTLTELRKLAEAATPGPWVCDWKMSDPIDEDEIPDVSVWQEECFKTGKFLMNNAESCPAFDLSVANGNFIAAANPATIIHLLDLIAQCKGALRDLYVSCPTSLECQSFHHSKREQHSYKDECGPRESYLDAIKKSAEALAAIEQWEKK